MNLDSFLRSRPRTASAQALFEFLSGKRKATSHKNTIHLFQTLHPLCMAFPDLDHVVYSDLVGWVEALTARYAVGSLRSKLIDIRTFFRWCVDTERVGVDVAKGLKLPRVRPRDKSASEADYLKVVKKLAEGLEGRIVRNVFGQWEIAPGTKWLMRSHVHTMRDLFLLVLLYETGCRAGEAAKLSTRAMKQALSAPSGSKDAPVYTLAVVGKTGVRYRSFTRATANLWGLWESVRPKDGREWVLVKWHKVGEVPKPLHSEDVTQIVSRRCAFCGVKPFRPHALRHAKAQRAKRVGGVQVAAALLDHHDLGSTLFYTADNETELNAAALASGFNSDLW